MKPEGRRKKLLSPPPQEATNSMESPTMGTGSGSATETGSGSATQTG
jgi:hypothetical protein